MLFKPAMLAVCLKKLTITQKFLKLKRKMMTDNFKARLAQETLVTKPYIGDFVIEVAFNKKLKKIIKKCFK